MKYLSSEELKRRTALDFNRTLPQIIEALCSFYPHLSATQIEQWEQSGALEYRWIDGKKYYFRNAARNLMRIDPESRKLLWKIEGEEKKERSEMLAHYIPALFSGTESLQRTYRMVFTLTVKADVIPSGQCIRCWLPYPRTDEPSLTNVRLITSNRHPIVLSPESAAHRSIYFEAVTKKKEPTQFQVEYQFTSVAHLIRQIPESVHLPVKCGFENLISEQLPHICFSPAVRKLADEITQGIESPYLKAQAIFKWISNHIPWASALEYSTIESIPDYVIKQRHGDCGQVSLLFISLCRYVGVPTRWRSGFMLHPGFENLHDWAEAYFDGLGWVPIDQSFGIQHRLEACQKELFFFGGIDAFRMMVNHDISSPLFPAKQFERSETVDFQRGEVEWKGGNLYFDSWDYDFKVTSLV